LGFLVNWIIAILVIYGLALIKASVLSIILRPQPRRRMARVLAAVLWAPIVALMSLLLILRFTVFREPPSLAELQQDFTPKRADLELILYMSDQDSDFSRIAPTFVDRNAGPSPQSWGRYMQGDPGAQMPKRRWDAYREIYARNGIKLGFQRNSAGDAFIMFDSVGLLNRGHTSGYLHCAADSKGISSDLRYQPCVLGRDKGRQEFIANPRQEAYSFQRLADAWYAYDEGPS
jgi:hypothetical protein